MERFTADPRLLCIWRICRLDSGRLYPGWLELAGLTARLSLAPWLVASALWLLAGVARLACAPGLVLALLALARLSRLAL